MYKGIEHDWPYNRVQKNVTETEPLEDPVAEGHRVIDAAENADLTVRLIGGTAIREHSETAREGPFEREYRDVDFVTVREDEDEVVDLMTELGYDENERLNRMHRFRLEFHDPSNDRKADYIVDRFDFSHEWSLRGRVEEDAPTVPIEDLLLSKLQIFEISDRDIRDIIAMLNDHPIETGDDSETIDPDYVAGLCRTDWGLYKTTTINLDRVTEYLESNDLPIDDARIDDRIDALRTEIEEVPKSVRWKLRSLVGERKQWYKRPELS